MNALLPLVQRLKNCPTQDDRINAKGLVASWNSLKIITPELGDTITPALLVGVILYDLEGFGPLLLHAEREQLIQLGQLALRRYQERTNPPNKPGKLIAAALKEVL
jgi:hypothetical protein